VVSAWWIAILAILDFISNEVRERRWRQERKDLYSRIMAGSLTDFREDIAEKPPPTGRNIFKAKVGDD